MRFDMSQQLRLGQQMKLAPRMIQSMEILQLPLQALQERIEQELESNVALELVEPGTDGSEDLESREEADVAETLDRQELVAGDDRDFARLSEFERSYGEAFDNEYSGNTFAKRNLGERDRKMDAMANTAARGESLTEQLLHQWSFFDLDDDILEAGKILIQYVNDDGMLSADLGTICEQNRAVPGVHVTEELLERALAGVQGRLDPPGIAARGTRESLLLQVTRRDESDEDDVDWTDVRVLISEHFEDLLQNRLPRISQKSGMSIDEIRAAMELMRKLNLTPGRDLVDDEIPSIVPDAVIEYDDASGEYVAFLADGTVPLLRVSEEYRKMAKDRSQEKAAREFATDSLRRASWLIDAVGQRRNTLLRVVNVVLARQREFFDYGPQHLRPLPMVEVADQLGIHVGTVSRAVADKWLQTPRGLVRLRRFFSGGAKTESGEEMSWEAVKATLREIIDKEDKSKPLSDEALSAELRKLGIDIARRTVVKYRSQMGIPAARLRKVH